MTTLEQHAPVNRHPAAGSAYRNLLLHVRDDPAGEIALDSAVMLADRLRATLTGVGVEGINPMAYSDGYGLSGGWISDLEAAIQQDLARCETLFKSRAASVDHHWVALQAEPISAMTALARGADLIIAGPPASGPRDTYRVCDTGALVLKSGRPVLVAPDHRRAFHGRAVVVAWKDTREARRALADALPFLKDADEVLVLEVCDRDDTEGAEARTSSVVQALQRHGVTAAAQVRVGRADSVADELVSAADAMTADLIVAGGYGHARLGELVFGGVTRELLRHAHHFVLFSH